MPQGTQVHVRFYFTPLNQTDSVLISERTLPPIPPFCQGATPISDCPQNAPPNWVLAQTKFDTSQFDQTKNGNVSVMFWVLVWMQRPDGKLVLEMPGHGLTGVPGTLTSFADAAKLEECQTDGNCYSNNLGFYKQAFYIAAPTTAAVSGPLAALTGKASVDISNIEVPTQQINRNTNVVVSATLSPSAAHAAAVTANFYDGDPQHGGRLFDVEQIPYIAKNQKYLVETLYRAKTCGVHELFVVVDVGQQKMVQRASPVTVACGTPQ